MAVHTASVGHPTRLWARRSEHANAMRDSGRNTRYLGDHDLGSVEIHDDLASALDAAQLIIVAIPSHGLRASVVRAAPVLRAGAKDAPVLIAAKGVEIDTLVTMAEVVRSEVPHLTGRVAALGGPSFAKEVAAGKPTAVVVGCEIAALGRRIQGIMSRGNLRVYTTTDLVGVELGGAFKNVIALAAGMTDGAGLGLNARAGLITRGLAEIGRLATKMGADPATLSGLAGLGDLVLTCTGGLSRNRRVGVGLGEGRALHDILDEMGMVAEGVKNTRSAYQLAQRERVEMPIVETVHDILYGGLSVSEAVQALMQRALKPERG